MVIASTPFRIDVSTCFSKPLINELPWINFITFSKSVSHFFLLTCSRLLFSTGGVSLSNLGVTDRRMGFAVWTGVELPTGPRCRTLWIDVLLSRMIFMRCFSGSSDFDEDGDDADEIPDVTEAVDGLCGSYFIPLLLLPPPPMISISRVDTPLSLESSS